MATIFTESFETDGNGTRYTTSITEFSDGYGDFFTRTDGSNIGSFYQVTGGDGSFFFAAQDLDGEGAASEQTLLFSAIDISGFTNLNFSALFAEDDDGSNQDWDIGDFLKVEYQIDSGGFQNLLAIESVPDGDNFNAVPAIDTDFDGDGDGTEITSTFAEFGNAIASTGSSLDLRFTMDFNSGDEDIAIDNIFITGDSGGSVLNSLVFNEVLPDPNSSGTNNFDTDGDGTAETGDEFVELYNTSGSTLDIGGLQFWDFGSDNYLTIPGGTMLGPNGFVVVVADVTGGSLPTVPSGSFAFSAGAGGSGILSNSGDNLVLYDPTADEYIQAVYNGDGTDDPTASYTGFSATATQVGSVLDFGNDTDGVSLALSPDGTTGNPVQHNTIGDGSVLATPGNSNIVPLSSVLNSLVFNEVLPDPNSGTNNFDTDGDGTAETADEFVELYNTSGSTLDIGGLQFWDFGSDNYLTIPGGTMLGPNGFVVVVADVTGGSLPTVPSGSFAFSAGGGLSISNSGDNLVLYDPATDEYIQAIYNGDATDDPTATYTGFSATATQIGSVLDFGNDTDGVSLALSPDGTTGNPVQHNTIGSGTVLATPGNSNVASSTTLAIAPTTQNEGNSGTTAFTFTVTRSGDTSGTTTVDFATLDGTAIDGGDYTGTSGTVTFAPGDTSETITVNVIGDTDVEVDENFTVTLFNPSGGATISTTSADGTIQNDDGVAITKIHAIQGTTDTNLLDDTIVTIEAIVVGDFQDGDGDTGRDLRGFYLQEEDSDADGNALTSEGIFIFENGNFITDVNVGDLVQVTGTVDEFFGETQIDTVTNITVVSSGNTLPTAASISLPAGATSTNQDGDLQPDLEAFEGMLVTFPDTLTIAEMFQLDRFNEIKLSQGGRPEQFTQNNAPSVAGYAAHLQDVGSRTITYDDGLSVQNGDIGNLDGFGPTFNTATDIRMGDTIANLSGVLSYQWAGNAASGATWRVRATVDGENTFTKVNNRPATPDTVGGDLKVAGLNVLNYFTTLDEGSNTTANGNDPRGADNTTEFDRQTQKLVTALEDLDADIVGLVELENDFQTGSSGNAIENLVDELNAVVGAGTYDWVDPGTQFVGDDTIAVGVIYKTSAVNIASGTSVEILTDSDLPGLGISSSPAIFDGSSTNRSPLAVTFEENSTGEAFTVVVNHLKSKGSPGTAGAGDNDLNDGAGNANQTRLNGATALDAWLDSDPTGSGDSDFLILGDLNAYAEEDPITFLEGEGYTDLAQQFIGSSAYSFVFDGQTGTLDYALANSSLLSQVTGTTEWHINADEPDAIDYNTDFGRDAAIFDGTVPYRASDHDPVIVGLDLASTSAIINEVKANPPSGDDEFEYIELKGDAGELLNNLYLVVIDSNGGNTGTAEIVVDLNSQTLGSNGLLVAGVSGGYDIPADTTFVNVAAFNGGGIENDAASILLVSSSTAITQGTDYDTNDDGTLEGVLGSATIIDAIAWDDDGAERAYGSAIVANPDKPDALVRFPTNNTANDASAWYFGELVDGAPTEGNSHVFDNSDVSANFPTAGGQLTPGALNGELIPAWSGVIGDATNPSVSFTLSATPNNIEMESSNDSVVPDANLTIGGSRTNRTLDLDPTGVGYAFVTVTAKDVGGDIIDQSTFRYAASAVGESTSRFHMGTSDASTAIAIDANTMLVADDEDQVLRLYDRNNSGLPTAEFDFNASLGLAGDDEADLEASTRVGNTVYWIGSHSNDSGGDEEIKREVLFSTTLAGSTPSFGDSYTSLEDDLIAWDDADGHSLGAGSLGLAASAAAGVAPEATNGFSIEGLAMAPSSNTTAYLGFRAPQEDTSTRNQALIVPVTNFTSLPGASAGSATFDAPIFLDLGGRGIRSIERNANDEYLIIAGPSGTGSDFKLFGWTGDAADAPVDTGTVLPASGGSFEAIVEVPASLDGVQVQLLSDNGDTDWYGDGAASKKLPADNHQKFRSDIVDVTVDVNPPLNEIPSQANNWELEGTADFDGDGKADLLWRDPSTGENQLWLVDVDEVDGETVVSSNDLNPAHPNWKIEGVNDFNGDGKADFLLHNSVTGENSQWLYDGATRIDSGNTKRAVPPWDVADINDFNGDNKADILLRNSVTGENSLWMYDGRTRIASGNIKRAILDWDVADTNDFNGDNKADILLRNKVTGQNSLWTMDGLTRIGSGNINGASLDWEVADTNDFNGDNKADILWRNSVTGENTLWMMDGGTVLEIRNLSNAASRWEVGGTSDFDGDGDTDIFWRDPLTGENALWLMDGVTYPGGDLL